MLDTAAWEQLELSVLTEIYLDPKNVRLDNPNATVEADILEDLFVNEDALQLVDGISKVGYLTHDTPIVIKRRGKFIVVEGNRRVAALKAIQNPLLVPSFQSRISQLTKAIPNIELLSKIHVMVAPNQELANQLIATIHTGNLRKRWSPERQGVFFQAQIDAGRTYVQLKQRYPTIDVGKFVFRAHIVNALRGVNYDDPEITNFFTTRQWRKSLSTLARIYQSKDFLDLTGFVMDEQGVVRRTISDKNFKAIATIIMRGLKDNELNTRTVGTINSVRFTRLISELRDAIAPETDETKSDQEAPVPHTPGSSTPPADSGSGASASGGTATGGSASDAGATGGSATGGSAFGGSAIGGSATGGSASGWSASGGSTSGGSATGGSATGGSATGGPSTGAPASPGPGAPGGGSTQAGQSGTSSTTENITQTVRPKKEKTKFLPVGTLTVPTQYPIALRLHFQELSVLDIQKFPNTAFLMIRAVLEKSIKAFAELKGIDIRSSGNNTQGFVQLHHSLRWYEDYLDTNGPQSLVQPVRRIRSSAINNYTFNYTSTNDAMNAINHNHKFHVDPEEAINCWNAIDAVIRELMNP